MAIELRDVDHGELAQTAQLLSRSCPYDEAASVAAEKLFGHAPDDLHPQVIGAFSDAQLCGITATSGRWLRLLCVAPELRERGIGTALLAAAEAAVNAGKHHTIHTLAQPGNYLAPGIDVRNTETIAWLVRRGYEAAARNTNLMIDVRDNPRVSAARARQLAATCEQNGYVIDRARPSDRPELAALIASEFSPAWAFEIERALRFEPCGVHLARRTADGGLAAFAAHDGNNAGLGWFGPAGTFEAHRGRGLGAALLLACLVDVATRRSVCEVAWIGPRDFYERVAGIASERHFTVMRKVLNES